MHLCDPSYTFLGKTAVNRGNVLKVARKRKGRKSLNFTFNLKFLDLASILFTWLKFTCVNVRSQKRVSGNPPQRYVCVTDVFVRAAFLESVHYFGTSDYFSGRKKKEKNNLNDQNFKVYWKIRVEDRLKKNRGSWWYGPQTVDKFHRTYPLAVPNTKFK